MPFCGVAASNSMANIACYFCNSNKILGFNLKCPASEKGSLICSGIRCHLKLGWREEYNKAICLSAAWPIIVSIRL